MKTSMWIAVCAVVAGLSFWVGLIAAEFDHYSGLRKDRDTALAIAERQQDMIRGLTRHNAYLSSQLEGQALHMSTCNWVEKSEDKTIVTSNQFREVD